MVVFVWHFQFASSLLKAFGNVRIRQKSMAGCPFYYNLGSYFSFGQRPSVSDQNESEKHHYQPRNVYVNRSSIKDIRQSRDFQEICCKRRRQTWIHAKTVQVRQSIYQTIFMIIVPKKLDHLMIANSDLNDLVFWYHHRENLWKKWLQMDEKNEKCLVRLPCSQNQRDSDKFEELVQFDEFVYRRQFNPWWR